MYVTYLSPRASFGSPIPVALFCFMFFFRFKNTKVGSGGRVVRNSCLCAKIKLDSRAMRDFINKTRWRIMCMYQPGWIGRATKYRHLQNCIQIKLGNLISIAKQIVQNHSRWNELCVRCKCSVISLWVEFGSVQEGDLVLVVRAGDLFAISSQPHVCGKNKICEKMNETSFKIF